MERVAVTFVATAAGWGLTVSLEKTKLLSRGSPGDNLPIQLENGVIAAVDNFTYLGSNITNDGEVVNGMSVRLGKAARGFGCLRSSIFDNRGLSVIGVYCAVVLSTLLYGSETWVVKSPSIPRLEVFHNHCIWVILGVSRNRQWKERLTSKDLARWSGMDKNMADTISGYR